MVEIYTLGGELYSDIAFGDLLDYLKDGKRIEMPQKMPENIFETAHSCWKENPYLRPMFSELRYEIQMILQEFDPDYYYLYVEKYQ
uniref:Serine-threonine/tyrosine-protein kinase catalytic domain-containing protein n=1 Tax=Panagrolaimus davidi TaxID=227884 RepID=A0A914Q599_9BILA